MRPLGAGAYGLALLPGRGLGQASLGASRALPGVSGPAGVVGGIDDPFPYLGAPRQPLVAHS